MSAFKAENLVQVSKVVSLEPLEPNDPWYTDLSVARSTRDLLKLRKYLENAASMDYCACAAFIGHRGSGKSTELRRLEGALGGLFTPLHLVVDASLQLDCDYTDLLLWLVDSIVDYFNKQKLPLDAGKAKAVADWFADRTIETVDSFKREVSLETSAEAGSKAGTNLFFLAYSVKLLAKLKARVVGNREHRAIARQKLQNYSDELILRVNELLAHARQVLAQNGRPGRLLIVQDNLDRLSTEAALRLFRDNGDLLKQIQADCIWTAPINSRLAPFCIHNIFKDVFSMPTIKVHDRKGNKVDPGIEGLVDLAGKRMEIQLIFESADVVAYLAGMSGGSVRDLLRLVGMAQLAAQVDGRTAIGMESAKEAVNKLRLDFQGAFVPGDAYYPVLAAIARTKQDAGTTPSASPEQVENNRAFFAQLLVNGSILEYNGEDSWFDVHPAVWDIRAFRDAYEAAEPGHKAGYSH